MFCTEKTILQIIMHYHLRECHPATQTVSLSEDLIAFLCTKLMKLG